MAADFGETGLHVVVLLRVVVAGNPPGSVVARHGKLRVLCLHDEIVEILLLWELVAETDAVVVDTEAEIHVASV